MRYPEDKAVELMPREWQSERPKKREPIFGSGALPLIGELLGVALAIGLLILIGILGMHLKSILFGETRHTAGSPKTVVQNGYTYHLQPDGAYK